MIYTFVSRGFIDPRRADEARITFKADINTTPKNDKNVHTPYHTYFFSTYPEFQNAFRGREEWFENASGEKYERISGSGPAPEYPCPSGPHCQLTINLVEET
jgi:hypothetical protein